MVSILFRVLFQIWTRPSLTEGRFSASKFSPQTKIFGPRIVSAQTALQFPVGFGQGLLLEDIVSEGTVKYKFILKVLDFSGDPSVFVASESNTAQLLGGSGSHSLSIFTPEGYENLGSSNDWANRERFQAEAMRIVNGRLGLE